MFFIHKAPTKNVFSCAIEEKTFMIFIVFYIGFLCKAIQLAPGSLEKRLGIKGHIQAAMALGLPKIKFEKYIDRGTPQYKTL